VRHRVRRAVCYKPVPFQAKRKVDFLDQLASGALGRDATAIDESDRVPVFLYRLERAYRGVQEAIAKSHVLPYVPA
jgi:hypothetical protein